MQPRFVIVVLALKSDRVGQALTLRPFRTLFFYLTPRFVLRAPGELAVGVGQFLRRTQVVALVRQSVALGACASTAGLGLYRRRLRSSAAPTGGWVDAAWPAPRGRRCRVRRGSGLFCRAIGLVRAAFPGQGVAVPTEGGEAATQCEPASGRC